jgi:hypothetical protein
MATQLDNVLTGVIIVLVMIVVWRWYSTSSSCGSGLRMTCGCKMGQCRCRGTSWGPSGGDMLQRTMTGATASKPAEKSKLAGLVALETAGSKEGMTDPMEERIARVQNDGPIWRESEMVEGDFDAAVKDMALEVSVDASHKRYCDSLSFAGMPTGASACTTLSEVGRSINTSNFVGLTARKFCKARNLAVPGESARGTSSWTADQYCDIQMDELI